MATKAMKAKSGVKQSKGWIQAYSGKKFFYQREPWEHDDIEIDDIARVLSRTPRYAGHTAKVYSVAQHSVLVSALVEERSGSIRDRILGLLHDATEAYICDMPTPAKEIISGYRDLEKSIWLRISHKFLGEVVELPTIIKQCDEAILVAEAYDLFDFPPIDDWTARYCPRADVRIRPWSEDYACSRFLQRFKFLQKFSGKEAIDGRFTDS